MPAEPPDSPLPDPSAPGEPPTPAPRRTPRGCHPLVFGIVAATIQLGLTAYFAGWCSRE